MARASRIPGWRRVRRVFRRETLGKDAIAGSILGIVSVPDGLALGLLAGLNPIAGLYGYLFGMVGAAFFTSSTFMAVQATSAMSIVIADSGLGALPDPRTAVFTLAILTGVVMIIAGVLRGGRLLRFVPTAVMVGFVSAIGVNIILGQLPNLTGSTGRGEHRIVRSVDLLIHPGGFHWPTIVVGIVTMALIVVLKRTRMGSFGIVVAVIGGSALAALFTNVFDDRVATVEDVADIPTGLPLPAIPSFESFAALIVPALSLALIGLVQGAAVAAAVPNPDGRPADSSRNFIGQGAGNIVSGLFQGMPVGGSMSTSVILATSGARTRLALFIAAGVMAVLVLAASGLVGLVAMPALAALLIVVGVQTIKPARIRSVMGSGPLQTTIMAVTFVLTLIVPAQFAVLIGVGLAIIMFVGQQSNRLRLRQLEFASGGRIRERDPIQRVPAHSVVVLQPYGSVFFASAAALEEQLPEVDDESRGSVVVLRLRGIDEVGLTFVAVLDRYLTELEKRGSTLRLVVSSNRVMTHLQAGGLLDRLGEQGLYEGTEWLGESTRRAHDDGLAWVRAHTPPE
ncbi:SulP family inorganic anion transporter [Microbacterium deminutum]|uniref:SulP family inorganic anion transporter n=1 Tax=Microbacterium deminutum TaxID=344164 RepID=A0ABN2R793_9MICO